MPPSFGASLHSACSLTQKKLLTCAVSQLPFSMSNMLVERAVGVVWDVATEEEDYRRFWDFCDSGIQAEAAVSSLEIASQLQAF